MCTLFSGQLAGPCPPAFTTSSNLGRLTGGLGGVLIIVGQSGDLVSDGLPARLVGPSHDDLKAVVVGSGPHARSLTWTAGVLSSDNHR
jgi:hypothetical protein